MNFKPCLLDTVRTYFLLLFTYTQLLFCLFGHCSLSLIKSRDMLNNIDKGIKCGSLKSAKLKWVKMQNFRKIAKLRCREICEPQIREINVSRKFHVIRYSIYINNSLRLARICPRTFFREHYLFREANRYDCLSTNIRAYFCTKWRLFCLLSFKHFFATHIISFGYSSVLAPSYAGGIWKQSSISPVRPSVHTNPSLKRKFSKTLALRFSTDRKHFENEAFRKPTRLQ